MRPRGNWGSLPPLKKCNDFLPVVKISGNQQQAWVSGSDTQLLISGVLELLALGEVRWPWQIRERAPGSWVLCVVRSCRHFCGVSSPRSLPAVLEVSVHESPGAGTSPTQRETLESEHQNNGAFRISCMVNGLEMLRFGDCWAVWAGSGGDQRREPQQVNGEGLKGTREPGTR